MSPSPYTRFFFAHLIPGASLVCLILFLVEVPVEEGYRISLLEWSLDSDRVFPYVLTMGLVASAVLGAIAQAARVLLVDRWALRRGGAGVAGPVPGSAAAPAAGAEPPAEPDRGPAPPILPGRAPGTPPGPLADLYGNLALTLLLAVCWITTKILRGGGTAVFPRRLAYGVPLLGLAAGALLFAAYRRAAREGE